MANKVSGGLNPLSTIPQLPQLLTSSILWSLVVCLFATSISRRTGLTVLACDFCVWHVLNGDVCGRAKSEKREFMKSIKSRLTVSQVVTVVHVILETNWNSRFNIGRWSQVMIGNQLILVTLNNLEGYFDCLKPFWIHFHGKRSICLLQHNIANKYGAIILINVMEWNDYEILPWVFFKGHVKLCSGYYVSVHNWQISQLIGFELSELVILAIFQSCCQRQLEVHRK